jgi:hypothetical protein
MPPNTICVDRSTKWGNPFRVNQERGWTQEYVVKLFGHMLAGYICGSATNPSVEEQEAYRAMVTRDRSELKGKNLACWCSLGKPCHADVLLRVRQPR